jgi:hypothetical protein
MAEKSIEREKTKLIWSFPKKIVQKKESDMDGIEG